MPTAIIIHGAYGTPREHWIPWMRAQLEQSGYAVHVPQFPTPEDQSLENWLAVFAEYEQYLDNDSIMIAHSIGVAFTLNVLERLNKPIKAAYLVAGFVGPLGLELDTINKTIADKEFDWEKIKANCKHFAVISSDDDPYVPLKKGQELAHRLGVDVTLIQNAGHFNARAGYTQFPELLELIDGPVV